MTPARFKVLACGRRWGKTIMGAYACIRMANSGYRAWWVAPTFPIASIGWRLVSQMTADLDGIEKRESDRRIDFSGGGWLQVKSAHDPDSLRGEGLDIIVFDECAFARERAWTEALRPALSDRQGGALFISTPKGRNWFWQLWVRGQGDDPDWQSWQFPTSSNPHIEKSEIDDAQRTLPQRIFQQEYMAEFLEDAGSVFRNVTNCLLESAPAEWQRPVMGVDWGKHEDFTVLTVVDAVTGQMLALDRFNQIDYAFQVKRLQAMAQKYGPEIILAESNAMGEPLIEQLWRLDLPVRGFQTTNRTKALIIEDLALAFERGDIGILPEQQLVNELQAFEMERLPGGAFRYAAPEGLHDDCVISLALAWNAARGGRVIEGPVMV